MPSCSLPLSLGLLHYYRVGCTTIGLVMLQSGWLCYSWVSGTIIGLVAPLSCLSGALSLPAFVPPLCMLFPTTPCKGLTFTYILPYLAPVVVALGACP